MSPLVSLLKEHGVIEARSVHQRACFEAGVAFARAEGILPAPEPTHAIKVAIDEALDGEGGRRGAGHPVQPVRPRPLRPVGLRALPDGHARGLRVPGREGRGGARGPAADLAPQTQRRAAPVGWSDPPRPPARVAGAPGRRAGPIIAAGLVGSHPSSTVLAAGRAAHAAHTDPRSRAARMAACRGSPAARAAARSTRSRRSFLFAEERRCPRCGAFLEHERREHDRRQAVRRQNPPEAPGPPDGDERRRRGAADRRAAACPSSSGRPAPTRPAAAPRAGGGARTPLPRASSARGACP